MDSKELSAKLLEFFKEKYRGATAFQIRNVKCEHSEGDIDIYSFKLLCSYKREPYNLDYYIKFYKKSQAIIKTQVDISSFSKKSKDDPLIRFVGDATFFGYPFQIMDKDEFVLLKDLIN
jgi:hypothetical protein